MVTVTKRIFDGIGSIEEHLYTVDSKGLDTNKIIANIRERVPDIGDITFIKFVRCEGNHSVADVIEKYVTSCDDKLVITDPIVMESKLPNFDLASEAMHYINDLASCLIHNGFMQIYFKRTVNDAYILRNNSGNDFVKKVDRAKQLDRYYYLNNKKER